MEIEQIIRQVTVRGNADGLDKVSQSYSQVATSADTTAASVGKSASSAAIAEAALNKLGAQLQANFAQQQQFNEMMANQAQALAGISAANDNAAGSYRSTGLELAEVTNHLRQGAEAAYAFSPAFRAVVNEMAPAVLGAAGAAIAAVAGGIVTAVNYTGTGLIALAGAAEKLSPAMLGVTSVVRSAGVAMEGFAPEAAGVATSILGIAGTIASRFLPVLGQILLVYDAVKLLGQAWALGGERLKEYADLSAKAVAAGVSTDFLQRLTKSAEDAKIPVDTLTAALSKMQEALAPKLGGSDGLKELDRLKDFGNFEGNTGVTALKQATTPEQQFAAAIDFYQQATAASEKLAALDVMKTIFGPDIAKNLALDDQYLQNIQGKMGEVEATDLVKQADIDRAVALSAQYDAAVKILEQRWHPIQEVLADLGMQFKEIWIDIVSAIAAAVDGVVKLAEKLDILNTKLGDIPGIGPLMRSIDEANGMPSQDVDPMTAARQHLASGMSTHSNIVAARNQTVTSSEQLRPDKSIAEAPDEPDTGAYDRATGQLQKYIEVTNAAAKAVDAGVAEQEKLKAIAELTAAALKDGLSPAAAAAKAQMSGLSDQAAAAALSLAKAKVESQISFGAKTSLLSQEDVSIATQLKGIYPDVATALNSVEAEGLRTNAAMKTISSTIETNLTSGLLNIATGAKSASSAFRDMGLSIVKAIDEMIIKMLIVQPLMRSLGLSSLSGLAGGAGAASD
jgi:hypothetical protein